MEHEQEEQQINMINLLSNNQNKDNTQLRKIKFVEYELNDMVSDNLYTAGLYQLHFREEKKKSIKIEYPIKYSFDPAILSRIVQESENQKCGVVGLINYGASCYISSAVQALIHMPSFVSLLKSNEYKNILGANSLLSALNDVFRLYERESKNKKIISIEKIFPAIKTLGFSPYKQADAGELVYRILDQLATAEKRRTGFINQTNENQDEFGHLDKDTSAVDQLFYQAHVQFIECQSCGHLKTSQTTSRSLLIPMDRTLKRALAQYSTPQEIEGYYCENCQKQVKIKKYTKVAEVGELFMVQLQRWDAFGSKSQRSCRLNLSLDLSDGVQPEKIHDCGQTGLFQAFQSENAGTHELVAVLNHQGRADDGHYYAFVRCGASWRLCNDESVGAMNNETVVAGADWTVAFYAKRTASTISRKITEKALPNEQKNLHFNNDSGQNDIVITGAGIHQQNQQKIKQLHARPPEKHSIFSAQDELAELEGKTALHAPGGILSTKSDILHAGKQTDEPRRRKTQKMRDENRKQRFLEVKEKREFKTRQWKLKQQQKMKEKYGGRQ